MQAMVNQCLIDLGDGIKPCIFAGKMKTAGNASVERSRIFPARLTKDKKRHEEAKHKDGIRKDGNAESKDGPHQDEREHKETQKIRGPVGRKSGPKEKNRPKARTFWSTELLKGIRRKKALENKLEALKLYYTHKSGDRGTKCMTKNLAATSKNFQDQVLTSNQKALCTVSSRKQSGTAKYAKEK